MIPSQEEMYQALAERHGETLQKKISAASVAVCGLGGLGSNIAIALARAGIGSLHLIDFDRVDLANLNRQQYFPDQLGMLKTEALAQTLKRMAPYCRITCDSVRLTEENIPTLLQEELICEAFDRAAEKAMLVNTVLEQLPEKYIVAASGMAGLSSANTITTRKISRRFYLCGDGKSDVQENVSLLAARVMVCAAHQAHMILRIIAGEYQP